MKVEYNNSKNYAEYFCMLLSTWYCIPLITVSTLTVSPLILLLLYPIKRFRKLLSYCGPKKYHALYVFLDSFQGHYKDGTNGTRDYRAASCISFVLRFGVVYVLDKSLRGRPISNYVPLVSIMIITALFYSIVQPCKKKYMNNIESVLYCATGLLLLYFGTVRAHFEGDYKIMSIFFFNFLMMIIALPS